MLEGGGRGEEENALRNKVDRDGVRAGQKEKQIEEAIAGRMAMGGR